MYDPEMVIQRKIERSTKYLEERRPNPAIARGHKIAIRILLTAPRDEYKIKRMIESKKRRLQETTSMFLAEPIRDEIDALEWLLSVIRLQHEEHCNGNIV